MKEKKLVPAFTILELVFVIIIIAILATIAIPNLLATKDDAVLSSIKHEVSLITSSVIQYKTLKGDVNDISQVIAMDNDKWETSTNKKAYLYKINNKECINIKIDSNNIIVLIADNTYNSSNLCSKVRKMYSIQNQDSSDSNYHIYKTISLESLLKL